MHGSEVHVPANHTAPGAGLVVLRPVEQWYLSMMLCYPAILLVTFIVSAASHSIITSKGEEVLVETKATGPGGKPLPVTKKLKKSHRNHPLFEVYIGIWSRRMFQGLTGLLVFTFVSEAASVIVHAWDSEEGWWCGEERIVRSPIILSMSYCLITTSADTVRRSILWAGFSSTSTFS